MEHIRENYEKSREIVDGFEYMRDSEKEKVYMENLPESLKVLLAIIHAKYFEEYFDGNEDEMINNTKRRLIKITERKFVQFLSEIAKEICDEMGRDLMVDEFVKQYANEGLETLKNKFEIAKTEEVTSEFFFNFFNYIIGVSDNAGKMAESLMQISTEKQIEEEGIKPEDSICADYVALEKLSDKVWKAARNNILYAIRFTDYKEAIPKNNMSETKYDEKIRSLIKVRKDNTKVADKLSNYSIRYKNRENFPCLKDYSLRVYVEFDSETNCLCEISPFHENCLKNLEGFDKNQMFTDLVFLVVNIHKNCRKILCNLCPDKLVYDIKDDGSYSIKITDLYSVTTPFEFCQKNSHTGYESLDLLLGLEATPYDDLESLLYILNYMITGHEKKYKSLEQEKKEKKKLNFCNVAIKDAIEKIRILKQNENIERTNISKYFEKLYTDEVFEIFDNLEHLFVKVAMEPFYGTPLQNELYELMFNETISKNASNPNYNLENASLSAAEETFEIMYGHKYKER